MGSGQETGGTVGAGLAARDSPSSLEAVLEEYLAELADGRAPDKDAYLAEHPELANALRGVFRTLEFIEATGRSLDAKQLSAGRLLGDFRIQREVARGGMGVVYEAVQLSLDRRVALKVLPLAAVLSDTAAERFQREATTAAHLHHSNIVPVYAVGEEQGIRYYAMQFIEGQSLAEFIKRSRESAAPPGREHYRRIARWGQQIAAALDYAHAAGIIHRDIKPSNILLDARDNVWITDFGLARAAAQATLTVSGDVVGTARYMSPEQARGGRATVDARSDIYSLGATLYELVGGRPPFNADSREDVLNQILSLEPPPLRLNQHGVPRDLETVIAKCLEKDPHRRYARARDAAEDFRRLAAAEPILARRPSPVTKLLRQIWRQRWRALGALVLLVLAGLLVFSVLQARRMRGERLVEETFDLILFERNLPRANQMLEQAAGLGVDSARLHLFRGLIPLLNGQPQQAIPPLLEAYRRTPDDVEVGYALAYAYNGMADNLNGQAHFNRVAHLEIPSALGWFLRGSALAQLEHQDAIEAFNQATKLRPDFTPAIEARAVYRGNRLLTLGERGELDPMLRDYDAWVVFRPTSPRSYTSRGMGWLMAASYARTQADLAGQSGAWLARAEEDFAHARTLAGSASPAANLRSSVYCFCIGDFDRAAVLLQEILPTDPAAGAHEFPLYTYHLGVVLHAAGRTEEALRWIEPTCDEFPAFFPLHLHRALLLAEMGRLAEARQVCRDTLAAERGHSTGLLMAAAVSELLGDATPGAAALREYERQQTGRLVIPEVEACAVDAALAYFDRTIDVPTLMAADAGLPALRCELAFIVALRELGAGRRAAGLAALQECLDTGVFIFAHHRFATVLQARAAADPQWPRWLLPDSEQSTPASSPIRP